MCVRSTLYCMCSFQLLTSYDCSLLDMFIQLEHVTYENTWRASTADLHAILGAELHSV